MKIAILILTGWLSWAAFAGSPIAKTVTCEGTPYSVQYKQPNSRAYSPGYIMINNVQYFLRAAGNEFLALSWDAGSQTWNADQHVCSISAWRNDDVAGIDNPKIEAVAHYASATHYGYCSKADVRNGCQSGSWRMPGGLRHGPYCECP